MAEWLRSEIGIAALVKTEAPTGLRKRRPTGDSETAGTKKTKTHLKNMFAESCAKVKKIKGMRDQASTMIRQKKADARAWKWMSEMECDEVEKTIKNVRGSLKNFRLAVQQLRKLSQGDGRRDSGHVLVGQRDVSLGHANRIVDHGDLAADEDVSHKGGNHGRHEMSTLAVATRNRSSASRRRNALGHAR